jgi:hypothetical protein
MNRSVDANYTDQAATKWGRTDEDVPRPVAMFLRLAVVIRQMERGRKRSFFNVPEVRRIHKNRLPKGAKVTFTTFGAGTLEWDAPEGDAVTEAEATATVRK